MRTYNDVMSERAEFMAHQQAAARRAAYEREMQMRQFQAMQEEKARQQAEAEAQNSDSDSSSNEYEEPQAARQQEQRAEFEEAPVIRIVPVLAIR